MPYDAAPSDAALWLEVIGGTAASFGLVYERHRTTVFGVAYSRIGRVDDAEDVVSMVFLEAWRRRKNVRIVDGSLRPWLLVVALNVIRNRERTNRRYRRLLATLPPAAVEPDLSEAALDGLSARAARPAIVRAAGRLSAREREVFELCLVEGMPLAEVALALDVPIGTVKSRLSRVRQRLQGELGEFAPGKEAIA